MWSTPAVWKQFNKMAVLQFFLINSPLIHILFSLTAEYCRTHRELIWGWRRSREAYSKNLKCNCTFYIVVLHAYSDCFVPFLTFTVSWRLIICLIIYFTVKTLNWRQKFLGRLFSLNPVKSLAMILIKKNF